MHSSMEYATHVVQADMADESVLEGLGLGNFDVVVMAMGEDFEASLIATMMAKEQGAKHVVVKAGSKRQKKILESVGADAVSYTHLDVYKRQHHNYCRPGRLPLLFAIYWSA